jgi:hypothetical protein
MSAEKPSAATTEPVQHVNVDGEAALKTPLSVSIARKALRVMVPVYKEPGFPVPRCDGEQANAHSYTVTMKPTCRVRSSRWNW